MVSSNVLLSNVIKSLLPPGGSIQGSHNCVFKSGPLRANPGTLSCLITTIWEAQLGLNISQCLLSSDAIYHGKKLHPNKILELTAFIFANNHNPSPPPTTRLASPGKMWQPVVIRLLRATLQVKDSLLLTQAIPGQVGVFCLQASFASRVRFTGKSQWREERGQPFLLCSDINPSSEERPQYSRGDYTAY